MMTTINSYLISSIFVMALLIVSCNIGTDKTELKHFPVDNTNGIISKSEIQLDNFVSSDGNGSVKIETSRPVTIQLYDINDVHVDNTRLVYQARVKSENLSGQAYLEMWCIIKNKGEYFSRGLDSPIAGTTDWKELSTFFSLKSNEIPDQIRLNVVINGVGIIWIDDIRLAKL